MSSIANFSASEPAVPILAHSLLSQPASNSGNEHFDAESDSALPNDTNRVDWNLKDDIERGTQCSSNTIFRTGTVIGFSRLRKNAQGDDGVGYIGQVSFLLPLHLLTKNIRNGSPSTSKSNTFIIHPANFDAFSPQKLLASLLSPTHQQTLSREEAIKRLDSVQLLPVFDLTAAVQAISEISDILHKTRAEQTQVPDKTNPVVLIIAGLDTLAESVIRASNPVRGTAVLTTALRTLTQLSRMHASFLSVMLVNTSGIGTVASPFSGDSTGGQNRQQLKSQGEDTSGHQMRDDGIYSIFGATGTPLFPSLLMRTLEQGIDTHILLSTVKTKQIAEVIKDRVGDGVGKWCIWQKEA
ncbi:hypothetical protein ASPWEDRAFT_105880 [Aspergillus wentii DTO 134E9]|uniref:DNA recombination and repair protein Rad51-like C-terminal domain-containing protein n=1 Tax=Aspergillus wentii DTO 134E9 TaxID=1073089 RepID=A0A1L9RWN5_ASPWE|nr:uncharacterized protein ASPWEDRAFT_105880 [Aspergillus wentii DTO 134E9]OJJ39335.1 hypothetical protein ASPWEDRAFT_105880 [Aspergillus wentii DTO 134E9]